MKTAPRSIKVVNSIAIVGESVTAGLSPDVNLQSVVVPIEVGRGDLNPLAVHLTESGLIPQPGMVVEQKFFDLGDAHENSPFCILDGPVMLQCCMKASQVENRSSGLL